MHSKKPLNDAWLFWNAERIDDFPHALENDFVCETSDSQEEEEAQENSLLAMLEHLLLYIGGASAAMAGVGLVILIGSFVSAYSTLKDPAPTDRAAALAAPSLSLQQSSPHPSAAPPRAGLTQPAESGEVPSGQMDFIDGPGRARSAGSKFVGRIYTAVPRPQIPGR